MTDDNVPGRRCRPITDFLEPGESGLARLLAIARRINELDGVLAAVLDPRLAEHVRVATVRERELVLVTPVAAIAARLRLESPELIEALRGSGMDGIDSIRVRVAPLGPRIFDERCRRPLPASARKALEGFAEDWGDTELHERLKRSRDG